MTPSERRILTFLVQQGGSIQFEGEQVLEVADEVGMTREQFASEVSGLVNKNWVEREQVGFQGMRITATLDGRHELEAAENVAEPQSKSGGRYSLVPLAIVVLVLIVGAAIYLMR